VCGLVGVLRFDGAPIARESLTAMADALRHRGPDSQGCHVDERGRPSLALAHRRLSIIDLRRVADQPLSNEDGSIVVMLNGEIYNFAELRRPLEANHRFRSEGDTEVIAHLYEDVGEAAIPALDGMFALALWDAPCRRLLLATDPFGKKPLYYWGDGTRFMFASEIKALLAGGAPSSLAPESLAEYLAFGYVPSPRTLFAGIFKVPPASTLSVDGNGIQAPRPYWDVRFPPEGVRPPIAYPEATQRVRELLAGAVRKRLVADVPLGVLLSGGVDSSAVAALVAQEAGRVKTFTVGFEGDAFFDERRHAERVARHIGAEHHASVVRAEAAALVETLVHHHDEPFGDSSALPTYLVAREARKHVTVALNGDGGDETFAGYDRFRAALLAERIPRAALKVIRAGARVLPEGANYHGALRRIRRFTDNAVRPLDERMFAWSAFFDLEALGRLDGDGLVDRDRVLSSYREALGRAGGVSTLSRLQYLNFRTYLLDDLLPKMDRMTMAHALEARSPLLDRPLVEYVASLPDDFKLRVARGKVVLKQAVADLLPGETVRRRKHGFGVPVGAWFRRELRPMVEDTLLDRPRLGRWLRVKAVHDVYRDHMSGRGDRGHQLWTLLTLELWLRAHRFD
jgi:asparagine synthase (glutamine-hydrolysing)